MDRSHEVEGLTIVAELMCAAARTAPKGRGLDNLETKILRGDEKDRVAAEMRRIGTESGAGFFLRDAENLDAAPAAVVIGARKTTYGLPACGFCGFADCTACRDGGGTCHFVACDLGIAVGSAAGVASLHHIDNRIMFTIGRASVNLKLLGGDIVVAHGIPLSVRAKNVFFDRK